MADPRDRTSGRVVVADDSGVMRRLIRDGLEGAGYEVVAEAADGAEALDACEVHRPDVLTLDLSMPGINGLEVLEGLQKRRNPVQIVVVSSFSTSLVERALDVLDAGAADLVAKPKPGGSFTDFTTQVADTVAAVMTRRPASPSPVSRLPRIPVPRATLRSHRGDASRVLVIASSTGGPRALGEVVPALGDSIGGGGVLVQHMPPGFTGSLARRLDMQSSLAVREAVAGDSLQPGTLLVAPAGWHLRLAADDTWSMSDDAPVAGLRPCADLTIVDVAARYGAGTVLVVLTGMGRDGLEGARAVRAAGGIVLAQDESDCTVYGMPRHIIENDLADAVGTLPEIPVLIERALATPLPT